MSAVTSSRGILPATCGPLVLALALILAVACCPGAARADVRLPEVLGDHMVLQQDADVTLWGWAYHGERVVIDCSWGVHGEVVADAGGAWRLTVRTPRAQPLDQGLHPEHITFTVPGENSVQVRDLLIGELWLCSGQSNMAMMLGPDFPPGSNGWYGEPGWEDELKSAERPGMRFFNVEKTVALLPQTDCKGVLPDHVRRLADAAGVQPVVWRGWQPCSPATAVYVSAVAYHFAVTLQGALNVPVGVVGSYVGGSKIAAWTSLEARRAMPGHAAEASAAGRDGSAGLFNGMIAPLVDLRVRGFLWYQGESDRGAPAEYAAAFAALIGDWRHRFGHGDLPFLFVQVAPFHGDDGDAAGDLRASQASALALPGTGMVVTNDISDPSTIHPSGKREVGRRLAWQALRKAYGSQDVVADGPHPTGVAADGAALRIAFADTAGGLVARDRLPLRCFAVAGADGVFRPAQAQLAGDAVLVSAPLVAQPRAVRFAWGADDLPNLSGGNGLPVAQFRLELR